MYATTMESNINLTQPIASTSVMTALLSSQSVAYWVHTPQPEPPVDDEDDEDEDGKGGSGGGGNIDPDDDEGWSNDDEDEDEDETLWTSPSNNTAHWRRGVHRRQRQKQSA